MNGSTESSNTKVIDTDVLVMNLKINLRFQLNQKNTTAAQLSRATNIPKATISDWLAGVSPKKIEQVKRVADFFNISVDELVFGADVKKKPHALEGYKEDIITGIYEVILRPVNRK